MYISRPLVSCLCITEGRVDYLKRAYEAYSRQSYGNLELLVVAVEGDYSTLKYLSHIRREDTSVRYIVAPSHYSLGRRRNYALENAMGEYICVWDDDDIYHVERVERCMDYLLQSHKRAVALARVLIWDTLGRQLYMSTQRVWEQTLLCEKHLLLVEGIRYADLDRGEDSALVTQLESEIFPVMEPHLYIYCRHGRNTSPNEHFDDHFRVATRLPNYQSRMVDKFIEGEIGIIQASHLMSGCEFQALCALVTPEAMLPWGVKPFSIVSFDSK